MALLLVNVPCFQRQIYVDAGDCYSLFDTWPCPLAWERAMGRAGRR
jgi:hypothetical protein